MNKFPVAQTAATEEVPGWEIALFTQPENDLSPVYL